MIVKSSAVRRTALAMLYRGKAAHVGSSMSTVEMITAMYGSVDIEKIKRGDPDRSRIIISKGHCAAATYAAMVEYGLLDRDYAMKYHSEGTELAGLVSSRVPHVEHSTGALGHGLSVAVGCAVALRAAGHHGATVLCLLGDGDLQEGSNWESLMLIRHHKLTNLFTLSSMVSCV